MMRMKEFEKAIDEKVIDNLTPKQLDMVLKILENVK